MTRPSTPEKKQIKAMGAMVQDAGNPSSGTYTNWVYRSLQANDDIRIIGFEIQLDIWREDYDDAGTGYHSAHVFVGTTPYTESDRVAGVVPNGIFIEAQCLSEQIDGGAFADMINGTNCVNVGKIFPEGYGIDLDKNDYIEISMWVGSEGGYTSDSHGLNTLTRVKVLYVER